MNSDTDRVTSEQFKVIKLQANRNDMKNPKPNEGKLILWGNEKAWSDEWHRKLKIYCFLYIGFDIDEFMLLFSRQKHAFIIEIGYSSFSSWNLLWNWAHNTHSISMFAFLSKFLNSFSCMSDLGFRAGSKLKMLCFLKHPNALWACFAC